MTLKRVLARLVVVGGLALAAPGSVQEAARPIYFPMVFGPAIVCYGSAEAAEIARILLDHPGQQRRGVVCHDGLVWAAQKRAASMAEREYFGHCDPDGVCANTVARESGCMLPGGYGDGNGIESIAAGSGSPQAIAEALLRSDGHMRHLLGLGDFYGAQTNVGIAMVERVGSPHQYYWSILFAPCG